MRVRTRNEERTIDEMTLMFAWVMDTFGNDVGDDCRWSYGKDPSNSLGGDLLSGTWEIEWFDFRDDKDATMFMLRWP
jgi:hypothetical protein